MHSWDLPQTGISLKIMCSLQYPNTGMQYSMAFERRKAMDKQVRTNIKVGAGLAMVALLYLVCILAGLI